MKFILKIINTIFSFFFIKFMNIKVIKKFSNNYGKFLYLKTHKDFELILNNESNIFLGEIVKMILDLPINPKRILLAGENIESKKIIKSSLSNKLQETEIITAGLMEHVDYKWNFEFPQPDIGEFDLVISQAMIEHLIDPYKHVKDLANYLTNNGYLLIHSVLPGFEYHRHPIDSLRFYPDWFEEIAKPFRLNLEIKEKYIRDFHIFYKYKKLQNIQIIN